MWTLEMLFHGRPAALALYRAVERTIQSLGPVDIKVTKTQVSFAARTQFAWVWLPQLWTQKRPEMSITLSFSLDHELEDPRIAQTVEPVPGRWMHHMIIENESDLDDAVKSWLRQAYDFGQIDRRKRRTRDR